MSVLLHQMELNELCKPYGTELHYWLDSVKNHGEGMSLPSQEQLRQYYHRGKTVSEVLILAKRSKPLSV